MVAGGVRKAAEMLSTGHDAPPGMEHYQADPIGFVVNELGIRRETIVWSELPEYEDHEWDGTPDPIATWFRGLAEWKDVGVESGTGTGKSFGLGLTKLWFLASWQGARAFDYATTKEQLQEYSWVEMQKLWTRFKVLFPMADMLPSSLRIRMDGRIKEGEAAGWGALGRAVKVRTDEEISASVAGMHGAHMLISVEEAQGFPHAASEAIENTSTAPHNLRQYVGNPDAQDDALHQACLAFKAAGGLHIRISALDHPNVVVNNARDPDWKDLNNDVMIVPGAVSRASILRRKLKYGTEHRHYMSRVRGFSPPEHQDALIRQVWIDRAVERWKSRELYYGLPALAADVARSEDGDYAAIAEGVGAHLEEIIKFHCDDVNALGLRIAARMALRDIYEQNVGIDTGGGYGGGTIDKLKELDIYPQAINPGARPVQRLDETRMEETGRPVREVLVFKNRRASDWWHMAVDLQMDRLALPPDEELHEDLRSVRWESKGGKIVVEDKQEVAKRLMRSPDKGDAAVMWNAVRQRIVPEEDEELRAWDEEALLAELEHRRIRDTPPARKDRGLNPTLIERIE
jgi:hypothetical protein